MPLTVNVGLSRKSSENYQSRGLSINLTAELDQSLLADPPRLQVEIDRIYSQAEDALKRQSSPAKPHSQPPTSPRPSAPSVNVNGRAHPQTNNGHGHANSNGRVRRPSVRQDSPPAEQSGVPHGGPVRPATESQMRALRSLAKRLDCELEDLMIETFGEATVYADIRMASKLIDILKQRVEHVPPPVGYERGRA